MIRTKADLDYYLQCDAIASKKGDPTTKQPKERDLFRRLLKWYHQNRNLPWEYLVTLRTLEYTSRMAYGKLTFKKIKYKLRKNVLFRRMLKLRRQTNIIVNSQQLGAGAYIPYNNVIITPYATIGENCLIESGVVMGITSGIKKGPRVGRNVFIGTGAKLIGDIEIADGTCVGANAVVTKSITEPYSTVAGVPARIISQKGSRGFLIEATDEWAKAHGAKNPKYGGEA